MSVKLWQGSLMPTLFSVQRDPIGPEEHGQREEEEAA